MSPTLQFQLQVYAASIAGQRAHPYPPQHVMDMSKKAWKDAQEALISMPPALLKQLQEEEGDEASRRHNEFNPSP